MRNRNIFSFIFNDYFFLSLEKGVEIFGKIFMLEEIFWKKKIYDFIFCEIMFFIRVFLMELNVFYNVFIDNI